MGRKSRPTFKKRQKEIARQQKARDKTNRRLEKKEEESDMPPVLAGDEDPDIAGIQPGPQPLPEEWNYQPGHIPARAPAADKEAPDDKPAAEQKSEGEPQKETQSP